MKYHDCKCDCPACCGKSQSCTQTCASDRPRFTPPISKLAKSCRPGGNRIRLLEHLQRTYDKTFAARERLSYDYTFANVARTPQGQCRRTSADCLRDRRGFCIRLLGRPIAGPDNRRRHSIIAKHLADEFAGATIQLHPRIRRVCSWQGLLPIIPRKDTVVPTSGNPSLLGVVCYARFRNI